MVNRSVQNTDGLIVAGYDTFSDDEEASILVLRSSVSLQYECGQNQRSRGHMQVLAPSSIEHCNPFVCKCEVSHDSMKKIPAVFQAPDI
jgi:hypothetical protein